MVVVVASLVAACGSGETKGAAVTALGSDVQRVVDATSDPHVAGDTLLPFGADAFRAISGRAAPRANVVVSPLSLALALAMLEPGATGDAGARLDAVLRIHDPESYRASMNALVQSLESRKAESINQGDKPGELAVRVANAAYLQHGYPFERAYVDTIARNFGPALNEVDFRADPDAVAHAINRFVAETTHDRIKTIVPDGALKPDDVLALVNALYLKASWLQPFDPKQTHDESFTRHDGTTVKVPMMRGRSDTSASGDGWVAATKSYVGGLAVQFVLPDRGRFDEVAAHLTEVTAAFDRHQTKGALLGIPRFETAFGVDLEDAFKALGLDPLYEPGHLLGIADDPRLQLDLARHQTYLAMDEQGTEGAAATVLVGEATSGPVVPPVPVVLDRPFLFRIFDQRTGATLFVGAINDPTS